VCRPSRPRGGMFFLKMLSAVHAHKMELLCCHLGNFGSVLITRVRCAPERRNERRERA
jgi:hypothetical protein